MDVDRSPTAPSGTTSSTTLGELAGWVERPPDWPNRPAPKTLAIEADVDPWDDLDDPAEVYAAARTRRAPYIATGATAVAGYAAWGAAELAAASAGAHGHSLVVTGTVAGTALAVPALRALFRNRIPDAWRRRWWLATAAGAAWIDVTAVGGASWEMLGVLVVGAAAISARWAAEHELANPSEIPAPAPRPALPPPLPPRPLPAIDMSRGAQIEEAWRSRVSAGRNPVAAGSHLTQRVKLPNGDQWVVELDPEGSVGCTDLVLQPARIARAVQVNPAHVILERLTGADDREDLASLTVVTRDLLVDGVPYTGPRYADGCIPIGLYADGTGEPEWIAYDGTGVLGGVVAGGKGTGKSALLAALAMAFRASGEWTVLFGDGDEMGNSSRLLKRVAHDVARGPVEVLQQLEALEAWYRFRGLLLPDLTDGPDGAPIPMTDPRTQESVDWIRPCRAYPGTIWIIDELHRLADDPMLKEARFIPRAAKLTRILRKLGGAIIVGTQSLLGADFGGDAAWRGMLAQDNLIALRNGNKSEQHVVGDFGIAPSTLPAGGGYAFGGTGGRCAMMRVAWSKDMHRWADDLPDLATGDPSAQVYARHRAAKTIDPVAEHQRRQRERAEWNAALASGAPLPGEATAPTARADQAEQSVTVGGVKVPQAPANVIPLADRPPRPAPVSPLAALGPLPTKAAAVLAVLRSRPGPWRSRDLVAATDLSRPDVSKALSVLVARGLAHRVGDVQGVYAAGAAPSRSEAS